MFSSPVLDLVILLSFIYFIGSLILSSINEAIAGTLRLRPKQLQESLEQLFFDPAWTKWVQGTLKTNPHIQSLMKASDKYPSYIPASNFVLAVISQLGASNYNSTGLQTAINASTLPIVFKSVLTDLAAEAQNATIDFEKKIELFYNNAMDRAGGVYKKQIRLFTVIIALIVAICLNLDTVKLVQDELGDKAKLAQVASDIAKQVPLFKQTSNGLETTTIQTKSGAIAVNHKVDTGKKVNADLKQVSDLTVYLGETSGFTTGYSEDGGFCNQWAGSEKEAFGERVLVFFKKLLGILITAFALQLSSSFWFDLMSKIVNVRAAGNKPKTDTK